MTKRTSGKFKRRKQDQYDTPASAVLPLLGHVEPGATFLELCGGSHDLVDALSPHFKCIAATDVAPRDERVFRMDALTASVEDIRATGARYIITNPPWTRDLLHQMIEHFAEALPTWLLFDADWIHTKQAIPYRHLCRKIVSVGRVSWMQNGTSGLDNCQWYCFDANHVGATVFHFREAA